jgi:hypothetical protein
MTIAAEWWTERPSEAANEKTRGEHFAVADAAKARLDQMKKRLTGLIG